MKIDVTEDGQIRLKEVFNGVVLETEEGNQISVCMRDDTVEIHVMPAGWSSETSWYRANMQDGTIEKL